MTVRTRVNIRNVVNNAMIRRERRHGRDVVVVPSATLPDNIVMNRIRYPAAEIAKAHKGLENTPAPLGHPSIEGAFVSASDPRGIVRGFVGAWNENVRQENGRVMLDKVIDVEYAGQLSGGKAVLAAIDKGEPVHTSTGLYAIMQPIENDESADSEATDIIFDHDAILLGEDGAATPQQGVGMLVNRAVTADGTSVDVINSSMVDDVDHAVSDLARAIERRQKAGALERIKATVMEALGLSETKEVETQMADDKQLEALSAKVDGLAEVLNSVVGGLKSLTDAQAVMQANQRAAQDAELADLRGKIIKANILDEVSAGELTLNAARALAKQAEPGKAAGLHNGLPVAAKAEGFKLPKGD